MAFHLLPKLGWDLVQSLAALSLGPPGLHVIIPLAENTIHRDSLLIPPIPDP